MTTIEEALAQLDPKIRKMAGEIGGKTKKDRIKDIGYTEKELAAQIKNKNTLINYNKSEEGRKRVSKFMKGRKPKPFTDEQKQRIGNASKGRIPTNRRKVIIMNVEYLHMHEASKMLNVPLSTIQNRLLSKNFKDWNYCK